ncbi:MAG: ATP-binding protein [Desulfobacterales bacterium]|nr:ATP-binding protein [Desulfobacterales bacterium]
MGQKLLATVCVIVTVTVFLFLAAGIWFEEKRHQRNQWERLYYKTTALSWRMGHLLYANNIRYLMLSLGHFRTAHPEILYAVIQDTGGKLVVAAQSELIGLDSDVLTEITNGPPVFMEGLDSSMDSQTPGSFKVLEARLKRRFTIGDDEVYRAGDAIYEAVMDIQYLGRKLGILRLGYSNRDMAAHLEEFAGVVLATGGLVLLAVLFMLFWAIRRHLRPLDTFVSQLGDLQESADSRTLIRHLESLDLEGEDQEIQETRNLKQAVAHVRGQYVENWIQLEQHRHNLENMVAQRTLDLNRANLALNRQIQERREIETRMLTIQKMEAIGTLAGGIAHEFNNIFMAITGNASLIKARTQPGHPNMEKTEKICFLVEKGAHAIQQLLGFARSGKYAPGPLSLNTIIRSSLGVFSQSRKDLNIKMNLAQDLRPIVADHSQMEQVVMNLLVNASDAMPGKGTLTLTTENVDRDGLPEAAPVDGGSHYVCLSVVDQGPGIDPDVLPRIFEPFFTTKNLGEGSGLGLASVYGIVENHGGFTRAENGKAEGAIFRIFLPAQELAESKETNHEEPL